MDNRAAYRDLSETERSIPLFLRAWWLDATCGEDGWDAALVLKGGVVHGALPFRLRQRLGFRIASQPPLTPFLGPWLRNSGGKRASQFSQHKEVMTGLIDQLPRHHHYQQSWSPDITNWLPFYWKGFNQSTRYTYVIRNMADTPSLWAGLQQNIRAEINKARNRFKLSVDADASVEDFLKLSKLTFGRQGRQLPYSEALVRAIDTACSKQECRRIFIARDAEGRPHAGVYVVWSEDSAYYLMGGADPALRNSGAASLCMWEAISFASEVTHRFDFEGSMIEPIERFFRGFGAEQTPYFKVTRTTSRTLATALALGSIWRKQ